MSAAKNRQSLLVGLALFAVVIALLVLWFGLGFLFAPVRFLLGAPEWFVGILGLGALSVAVARMAAASTSAEEPSGSGNSKGSRKGSSKAAAAKTIPAEKKAELARKNKPYIRGGLALVSVAAVGVFLLPFFKASAYVDSYQWAASVPSYEARAPFVVADQLSNRDLDDVIGDRVGVHSVPSAQEPNSYTTLVIRRGMFEGYEAVQVIRPPLVGGAANASTACRFDPSHKLRLGGGVPWNDLDRAISFRRPLAFWDETDAFGICQDGTAAVVVPLKRWGGTWPAMVEKPAGVAVYSGGELTVYSPDEVPAALEGPTYPRSVAAQQRMASRASGSFADWLFNRAGYDTAGETVVTEDGVVDESEPNRANAVDFSLVTTDGKGEYVTALTPVGASESVVAAGHVSFRQTSSQLNAYLVSRYDPALPALSTSENRIRSDFNNLSGWASGMRVMEITPSADGTYIASIGQNQVVTYRVLIATDGSVSMLEADKPAPAPGKKPSVGKDLSTMTEAEIVAEINRLAEELARRSDG